MNLITAIILTKNEELHIQRCIDSLKKVCCKIYVIDSYSTDSTCKIATDCGAVVIQNTYVNQAQQFQWALDNCQIESDWVMRLDADEYLTEQLIQELQAKLSQIPSEVKGVYLPRKVKFLGHVLRFGNLKPVRLLRLWRNGCAYMEQRWMSILFCMRARQ